MLRYSVQWSWRTKTTKYVSSMLPIWLYLLFTLFRTVLQYSVSIFLASWPFFCSTPFFLSDWTKCNQQSTCNTILHTLHYLNEFRLELELVHLNTRIFLSTIPYYLSTKHFAWALKSWDKPIFNFKQISTYE